jgi:AraC-like DNA-binding protein
MRTAAIESPLPAARLREDAAQMIDCDNETAERPAFHHRHVSSQPLSGFVSEFWYWRGYSLPRVTETILPWGTVELVINLSSSRLQDSVVAGPQSQVFVVDRVSEHELVGIHFKPGGAYPFLSIPYFDLHNRIICIGDVWKATSAEHVITSLLQARSIDEKLSRLEEWLIEIATRPLRHHAAVVHALHAFETMPNAYSSAAIAEQAGLSQRRFIQLFRDEVGLSPKLFCRIRRFHDTIAEIGRQDDVDWLGIAETNGYFDQAHFNHEFREFCGLTPSQYLKLRIKENLGHVRVTGNER